MSRSRKDAIIIVLDIGASATKHVLDDGSTFLDTAKKCIVRIIERKIFSSAGDEIGLVLLGSEMAANALQYNHIGEAFRMANPSWEMLKIINKIEGTDIDKCDWIDALVVAMDIMQNETVGKKFTYLKIVLFVDLDNDVSNDKLDKIINGIQKMKIEITAIGVNLFNDEENDVMQMDLDDTDDHSDKFNIEDFSEKSRKEKSEAVMKHILTECNGISCNFEEALSRLKTYQLKVVRPVAWNATLDIGHSIKIPVAAYKKISPVRLPTWQKTLRETPKNFGNVPNSESENVETRYVRLEQDRVYIKADRTEVAKEDLIAGYMFGSSTVPFNEYDVEQMRYRSGEKCLNVLGFARQTDVPRRLFIGEGVHYVLPQKKFPESQEALLSLIKALHNEEKVALATKVYRKDSPPKLVALFPLIKKKYKCLMLVELPFSEEVNEFVFPPVVSEKQKPTEEELATVDNLIDAMDLTKVFNGSEEVEAFHPKETVYPALMHQFRCIAHRALHPEEPLPPVGEDIKKMMACPFESLANYKLALSAVKDKFGINDEPKALSLKNEMRRRRKEIDSEKKDVAPQPSTSKDGIGSAISIATSEISIIDNTLVEIGTVKPHEDFVALVSRGEEFISVCDQMKKVILKLILRSFGSESYPKALCALTALRKSCVEKDPKIYNEWLPDFKTTLDERDRMAFWELVATDGLGLITSEENTSSSVSQEEAKALLKVSDEPPIITKEDELDVDDLFNEM